MAEQANPPAGEQQIPLKISDDVLRGVYANALQVNHNAEEFVMDFMHLFPPAGIVNARVIVTPQLMKNIVAALEDNIAKYEKQFGKIEGGSAPTAPASPSTTDNRGFGFRTE